MKLSKQMAFAATLILGACQSTITTTDPNNIDLAATQGKIYAPILITRGEEELLSSDTLKNIVDHNNIYWCKNTDKRPVGFDDGVC